MLWLMINRFNSEFFFWSHTNLPQRVVEDMMMRSVLSSAASFVLYFMGGLLILRAMRHRQEIREKGLKNGFWKHYCLYGWGRRSHSSDGVGKSVIYH